MLASVARVQVNFSRQYTKVILIIHTKHKHITRSKNTYTLKIIHKGTLLTEHTLSEYTLTEYNSKHISVTISYYNSAIS